MDKTLQVMFIDQDLINQLQAHYILPHQHINHHQQHINLQPLINHIRVDKAHSEAEVPK
jgi:hypothetical protein